jgi:hypothetical protein
VTSVENTEKCFKTLTSRTKMERESESESESVFIALLFCAVFIVCNVSFIVCIALCCVLRVV